MAIVPAGVSIKIEATVVNKDIGFVHDGQDVEVKVESFPFTKYGTIRGDVKTGKRRMIQYLLAPLQEYQDESLRER